jgi:hypothetical protein
VGKYLSENKVYSENCKTLQEGLFDTCCNPDTTSEGESNNSMTIVGATLGAILGFGIVCAFLMSLEETK